MIEDVMAYLASTDITSPQHLDCFEHNHDDIECLTQLGTCGDEQEFIRKHCGDGWSDETKHDTTNMEFYKKYYGDSICDTAHCNKIFVTNEKDSYDTTSLHSCMYVHTETCMNTPSKTETDIREDITDTHPDLNHAIRDCIDGEKNSNTMLDVQVLNTNDEKNPQIKS